MKSLQGCSALITGASSGIGAELSAQLAPKAKVLVLVARRSELLQKLAGSLRRDGLVIHCEVVDLQDPRELERLLDSLATRNIGIDFLVNNAGLGDHGLFETSDWKKTEAMLDVNIKSLTRLTHGLLPGLIKARGAILNISSVAGYLPIPGLGVYAATKAYVTSFSEALRAELINAGVTVTALCPGPVSTEFGSVAQRADETDSHVAPEILKVPVEKVVRTALHAVEHNRAKVVPGGLMSFLMLLTSFVPYGIIRRFFYKKR